MTRSSAALWVSRQYFDAACDPLTETCEPITTVTSDQQVRVELTIIAPNDLTYAVIEDPLPAGAEAIDPNLETSSTAFEPGNDQPAPLQLRILGLVVL